jgi:hypothetical protein
MDCPLVLCAPPAAVHAVADVHDTLCRLLVRVLGGIGTGTSVQLVPS